MALETLRGFLDTLTPCSSVAALVIPFCLAIAYMGPTRLLGFAKIKYWHSKNSLQLTLKNGGTTTIADLCKSLIPPCRLNPFVFNGHLQTMWTLIKGQHMPIYYKRRIFQAEDPTYTGQYAVDFVVYPNKEHDPSLPPRTTYYSDEEFEDVSSLDDKPMLVVLHGLSGGSHELYLRCVLAPLVGEGGWEACVVNSRGCSMTTITSSVLYNARATWDVRQTVKWLRKTFPNRPLFGCGFSLGANIITNYIGEEGSDCQFKAAVVLSNVWNNEVSSLGLQRTWFMNNVFNRALGTNMKKLFERHIEQISQNPNIDIETVRNSKYLHEFDRHVQGPTWGYPTEGAYYRDASSIDAMMGIRIPFLGIHALDDPVVLEEALPKMEIQATPYGVLCTTSLGGHLGWFELGGGRWFVKAVSYPSSPTLLQLTGSRPPASCRRWHMTSTWTNTLATRLVLCSAKLCVKTASL
jgi:uncharacterized protein